MRLAQLRGFRQIGYRPPASKSFDQQHAGIHAAPQDVDIVSFILKSDGLCGEDLEVRILSTDVSIGEDLQ
jgi:hypothetical protein